MSILSVIPERRKCLSPCPRVEGDSEANVMICVSNSTWLRWMLTVFQTSFGKSSIGRVSIKTESENGLFFFLKKITSIFFLQSWREKWKGVFKTPFHSGVWWPYRLSASLSALVSLFLFQVFHIHSPEREPNSMIFTSSLLEGVFVLGHFFFQILFKVYIGDFRASFLVKSYMSGRDIVLDKHLLSQGWGIPQKFAWGLSSEDKGGFWTVGYINHGWKDKKERRMSTLLTLPK